MRQHARFAYAGLDRLIHERSRLSILTSLAAHPHGLVFNDLKTLCALTDGNLSRQLQALANAGMVEIWKGQRNRRPQTLVRLTPQGRKRFADYLNVLESVLADAAQQNRLACEAENRPSRPATRGAGLAPA
ncbi:transcriptional regulator [Fontivita pretiosa]|uniref:transcriptional regulator n=1 Tax=Fontivita pretiosa TaxID=2989684 RepID=UPI003D173B95